jgi:hypothetical protein
MAGNVNTAPRALWRNVTRFKALKVEQRRTKTDANDLGDYPGLVNVTLKCVPGQTADPLQIVDTNDNVLFRVTTSGASIANGDSPAFGFGSMRCAHAKYDFALDGGAVSTITLATNAPIPANAIVMGGIINPTTAPVGATATLAFGTLAGSSATSLKAATAIASYTIDALMATVPVFTAATSFKMSAAGAITMTIATAALTAGVIEIFVFYVLANAA